VGHDAKQLTPAIQLSEHFVYIENQFFITSTIVDGTTIENRIGDALVQRIIRAHRAGEKWRACVVIPLLPGYTHPVDASEASSVRLILECQNRTICRGTNSIFSRLRKEGINPDDYINFFSLRGWGKFESGALTTEQVYIHGKTMIVDDRLVLCGSANINERSQRGDRDSELISVVRDTDMIDGTMAGKPFKVGRYAHTLRMRLMREHIGVDVDAIEEDELMMRKPVAGADDVALWDPDNEQDERKMGRGISRIKKSTAGSRLKTTVSTAVRGITKGVGENIRNDVHKTAERIKHPVAAAHGELLKNTNAAEENGPGGGPTGDTSERQDVGLDGKVIQGFASSVVPTLEERAIAARRPTEQTEHGKPLQDMADDGEGPDEAEVRPKDEKAVNEQPRKEMYGEPADAVEGDDRVPRDGPVMQEDKEAVKARGVLRKHLNAKSGTGPWNMPTPTPMIDPNRFHDPLDDTFWNDMWVAVAVHNTQIFRKVFRCIPDDLVTTWAQYKAFANHMDKFGRTEIAPPDASGSGTKVTHDQGGDGGGTVGPVGQDAPDSGKAMDGSTQGRWGATAPPSNLAEAGNAVLSAVGSVTGDRKSTSSAGKGVGSDAPTPAGGGNIGPAGAKGTPKGEPGPKDKEAGERKPSGENDAWEQWEMEEMEALLNETRGHLVVYPTRFLEAEDMANNFLFNVSGGRGRQRASVNSKC
jgi:phospholipase D1/2